MKLFFCMLLWYLMEHCQNIHVFIDVILTHSLQLDYCSSCRRFPEYLHSVWIQRNCLLVVWGILKNVISKNTLLNLALFSHAALFSTEIQEKNVDLHLWNLKMKILLTKLCVSNFCCWCVHFFLYHVL